jgi:EmrB/QacA subfamily drug resistance transporter
LSSQRVVLIAAILGSGVVFLDGTIVNVALPAIRQSLHGALSAQQWVVEAYLLTLSSLLLVGGSLGDLLGRRRVFTLGLAGFGVCSLVCAVAPTGGVLIAARAAQGVAGALLVPSTLALLMDTFDEGKRGAAIGSWTAWTGIVTVVGPLAGGLLVQFASWRWIFAVNLAPVAGTLLLLRHLPADRRTPGHVDVVGAVLCALGLAGPVFALIEQPSYGWSSPVVSVPLIAGIVLLVAFVLWERRSPQPMMPLQLFRSRNFTVGNVTTFTLYAGLGVATFFIILFIQQVGGYTPVEAGLSLLPITVMMVTLSRRWGGLADRIGPHRFMAAGPLLAGAGLLLLVRVSSHPNYASEVLPGVLVFGFGMSMTVAPLTATVLGAVEPGHSGLASGVNNAVARVANLIAIAALGAVVASTFSARLDSRLQHQPLTPQTRAALVTAKTRTLVTNADAASPSDRTVVHAALVNASVDAFHTGMIIAAALAVLGGLASLVGIENPRRRVASADCGGGPLGINADPTSAPALAGSRD